MNLTRRQRGIIYNASLLLPPFLGARLIPWMVQQSDPQQLERARQRDAEAAAPERLTIGSRRLFLVTEPLEASLRSASAFRQITLPSETALRYDRSRLFSFEGNGGLWYGTHYYFRILAGPSEHIGHDVDVMTHGFVDDARLHSEKEPALPAGLSETSVAEFVQHFLTVSASMALRKSQERQSSRSTRILKSVS